MLNLLYRRIIHDVDSDLRSFFATIFGLRSTILSQLKFRTFGGAMSVFDQPDFDQHEAVHCFHDEDSGLKAIVAIHSTALGPAAGGCRRWQYDNSNQATTDVL